MAPKIRGDLMKEKEDVVEEEREGGDSRRRNCRIDDRKFHASELHERRPARSMEVKTLAANNREERWLR